jgi:hypothetical protein
MTIFLEPARQPTSPSFGGGVADLGDIAEATRQSMLRVENSNASFRALSESIAERRRQIHSATGVQLFDPLEEAEREWRELQSRPGQRQFSIEELTAADPAVTSSDPLGEIYNRQLERFNNELYALSEKFPDARQVIGADRDLWEDAAASARDTDERLSTLMESRSGLGKYGALLAGGLVGALADPINMAAMAIGGGPGTARTIAGRILQVAGREALINAGVEASIQPMVQAWRERAGLDAGFDVAMRNVLFAGALGGVFGGGLSAAGEGLSRFIRPAGERRAAELAIGEPRLSDDARAMLTGDEQAATRMLSEIREALPPAARGALDELDRAGLTDAQRPAAMPAERHADAVSASTRAIAMDLDDTVLWPGFDPDQAQIARVMREIVGEDAPAAAAAASERSLIGFLVDRGGISDFRGELNAIGAGDHVERFRGRLVRQDGQSLDYAREAAAEAGYFDRIYGDPDTAAQRSTVADLLDLIEEDLRGNQVLPGMADGARVADEAAVAGLEGTIAAIARHAGPGVDDATLARAARIAVDERLDPFDALERVYVSEEPPAAAVPRTGEPLPGWSDEELLAASARRGPEPEPDMPGSLDNPGRLTDDDLDLSELAGLPDDFELPTENGLVSIAAIRADLERRDNMARVVEACRA